MYLDKAFGRFVDMIAEGVARGWMIDPAPWQDQQSVMAYVRGVFGAMDVPAGKALFVPIGTTPAGRTAVLAFTNGGSPGCMMLRDGVAWWVGSIKDAFASRPTESVTQFDGQRGPGARRSDAIAAGTRCFGTIGRGAALLCIAAGGGLIQTRRGDELVPWREVLTSIKPLDDRDQAFDRLWADDAVEFACYPQLIQTVGRVQRSINGQPKSRKGGGETRPSPSLGPARIILPGEAQEAASAPQIAPQRPVEPAPSNVVSFTPPAAQPAVVPSARQPHFDEGYEVWLDWRAKHGTPDADGIAPAWRVEGDTEGRWTYISSVATMLLDEVNDGPDDMYRKMRPAGFGARAVNAWLDAQEDARGKPISWRG